MKFGYARVSTQDQDLSLQLNALNAYGCDEVFNEKISARIKARPALELLLAKLRKGDSLVVWKLDRLGRSLIDLINIIEKLKLKGVNFVSLTNGFDTTTSEGKLMFNVVGSFAEFEKDIIRERTMAGLLAAKANGKLNGRPVGYTQEVINKIKAIRKLMNDQTSPADIYVMLSITRTTFYRYLKILEENTDTQIDSMIIKK